MMLRALMTRFIKKEVLDAAKYPSQLVKIDGNQKDVRRSYKEVDIGVAAKRAIGVSKMSDRETMEFRMQCIDFLAGMTSKLIEKSPLKYSLTRAVSCLVPQTLQNCRSVSEERMQKFCTRHRMFQQQLQTKPRASFELYVIKLQVVCLQSSHLFLAVTDLIIFVTQFLAQMQIQQNCGRLSR